MVLVVGVGGRALAERNHPGLMAERMSLGREQDVKSWDRILAPLLGFGLLYPHVIVAGLDHYYGWTKSFPLWVHTIAFVIILLGYLLAAWAIFVNRFFSLMVRIQIGGIKCATQGLIVIYAIQVIQVTYFPPSVLPCFWIHGG
jgi:hypothetical protein